LYTVPSEGITNDKVNPINPKFVINVRRFAATCSSVNT
jgi:hypothetical protein